MNLKNKGFTLIELLVVISIIGLLASMVMASMGAARAQARDSQRLNDLKQLQTALELYRNANGAYPAHNSTSYKLADAPAFTALAPYINVPRDPVSSRHTTNWDYLYWTNGSDYVMRALRDSSDRWCSVRSSATATAWPVTATMPACPW